MERRDFIKKTAIATAGVSMYGAISGMTHFNQSAPVLMRRNIEDLWKERSQNDQFKKFLSAMEMLKEGSPTGDAVKNSAFYQLGYLHNKFCVHGSSLFLPWHRALLTMFEKALQATAPEHADVTIPYFDFTNSYKVSGKYYPAAFQDPNTMLSKQLYARTYDQDVNNWGWEKGNTRQMEQASNHFSWVQQIQTIIDANPVWSKENRDQSGNYGFAGQLGGSGKSDYESQIHDTMHGVYIAGLLTSPPTAAFDPLFWCFHAFIDVVFWKWQQQPGYSIPENQYADQLKWQDSQIEVMKSLRDKLNIDQKWMKGTWTVGEIVDVKKLGYDYEYTPPQGQTTQMRFAPITSAKLNTNAKSVLSHTFEVTGETTKKAFFPIEDIQISMTTSYIGHIYLYPANEKFKPKNHNFIEKYLVDEFFVWAMPPMEGMKMMNAKTHKTFDLTNEINHLQNTVPKGEKWVIEVAVSGEELGSVDGNDFKARKKSKSLFLDQKTNTVPESDNNNRTFNFKKGPKLNFVH